MTVSAATTTRRDLAWSRSARDAALIAVFRATGIRLSELAGIRYDADDPGRSDVDL
jgi:site-specific recombinase XerD